VKRYFIRLEKLVENGFIESLNGKLRDECLNTEFFPSIADIRDKLEQWRHDYKHFRPDSSLSNRPPADFVVSVRTETS
jgi:putative transposase